MITWTRSRKELSVNRHVIDGDTLTITNTTEDDGGAYVCQGANELGSVMAVIWIIVKDVGKLKVNETIAKLQSWPKRLGHFLIFL